MSARGERRRIASLDDLSPDARDRVVARLAAGTRQTANCWLWLRARTGKYGKLTVAGKQVGAHRVAWEAANGRVPDGHQVCHRCDNPRCVRPDHLFTGTAMANMRDRERKPKPAPDSAASVLVVGPADLLAQMESRAIERSISVREAWRRAARTWLAHGTLTPEDLAELEG